MENVVMEQQQTAAAQSILTKSVAMILRCGYVGNSRRVELGALEMKKNGEDLAKEKSELSATLRLFSSADLKPCNSVIASVKKGLDALAVSGGERIFGPGCRLIPIPSIDAAEQVVLDGQALLAVKVEELVDRLPQVLEQRQAKLGPLFVLSDYPTADEIRADFSIDYSFASFATPEQLLEIGPAAYHREQQKMAAKLTSAFEDAVLGVRERAYDVLREFAERLTPGPDGKPKVLRGTALRDLHALVEQVPMLTSVTEDDQLMTVLARIGALANGADVEMLRKSDGFREMLRSAAEEAVAAVKPLVQTGRRAISFGAVD